GRGSVVVRESVNPESSIGRSIAQPPAGVKITPQGMISSPAASQGAQRWPVQNRATGAIAA
ncbi:MAG: hypothetical protein ACOC2Q_04005, partial [Spirochaetota bacterium]